MCVLFGAKQPAAQLSPSLRPTSVRAARLLSQAGGCPDGGRPDRLIWLFQALGLSVPVDHGMKTCVDLATRIFFGI